MEKSELRNLRIILIIFAILGPLSSYSSSINSDNLYNPMWMRVVISCFYGVYFIATFFSKSVRKNAYSINLVIIYFLTFFQIYLAYLNNFHSSFVSGYVFMAILGILYLKGYKQVLIYSVFTFVFLLLLYLGLMHSKTPIRGGSVIGIGITNLLFTMLKIYILNKEFSVLKYSKELSNSEQKYKNLLESAPDSIILIDTTGKIFGINRRASEIFLYDEAELIDKNIELFIPKQYGIIELLNQLELNENLSTREIGARGEINALKKDGEGFPVEISLSLVIDSENKHVIVIIRDISNRLNAEKELNEIKLKLQEKELSEKVSLAKSDFISKMSHEIRTPLTSISGFSNILLKEDLTVEQKKYLDSIKFSSELLNTLINDILDNSNLELGKIRLESKQIDFKLLIEKVVHIFKVQISKKEIDFQINYLGELNDKDLIILSDDLRLSQILLNLISNAIKFSHQKGAVELNIATRDLESDLIELEVSVVDYGIGISKDKFEDIFQPYIQGDIEISKKYEGNGLGLTIVKSLLDIFGGTIEISSTVKTVFKVKIALRKIEKLKLLDETEQVYNLKPSFKSDFKILFVEDNELNQFLVTTIFKKNLINYKIVGNGQLALDEINENNNYDLIIMDLMMPVMDGLTCTKILKNELKLKVPIVVFTADVKSKLNNELEDLFDGYLKKPFQEDELISLIERFQN